MSIKNASDLTRTLKTKRSYMYYSQKLGKLIKVKKHNQHYYLKRRDEWKKLPEGYKMIPVKEAAEQHDWIKDKLDWLKEEKKDPRIETINSLYGKRNWSDGLLDGMKKEIEFCNKNIIPELEEIKNASLIATSIKEEKGISVYHGVKECEAASLPELKSLLDEIDEFYLNLRGYPYWHELEEQIGNVYHRADAWEMLKFYADLPHVKDNLDNIKTFFDADELTKDSAENVFQFKHRDSIYAQIPDGKGEYFYFRVTRKTARPTTKKAFENNWSKTKDYVSEEEKQFKEFALSGSVYEPDIKLKIMSSMKTVNNFKGIKKNPKVITWMVANEIPLDQKADEDKGTALFYGKKSIKGLVSREQIKSMANYHKTNINRFESLEKPLLIISPEKGFKGEPKYPDNYETKFIIGKNLITSVSATSLHEISDLMGIKKKRKTKKSPALSEIDQLKKKMYIMPNKPFMPVAFKWDKDLFIMQAPIDLRSRNLDE